MRRHEASDHAIGPDVSQIPAYRLRSPSYPSVLFSISVTPRWAQFTLPRITVIDAFCRS
jgi:hypothetical protein